MFWECWILKPFIRIVSWPQRFVSCLPCGHLLEHCEHVCVCVHISLCRSFSTAPQGLMECMYVCICVWINVVLSASYSTPSSSVWFRMTHCVLFSNITVTDCLKTRDGREERQLERGRRDKKKWRERKEVIREVKRERREMGKRKREWAKQTEMKEIWEREGARALAKRAEKSGEKKNRTTLAKWEKRKGGET